MRKLFVLCTFVLSVCLFGTGLSAKETSKRKSGEALFSEFCAECHAGGGNLLNPEKTLHKKSLEANNIKTPEDIVNKMRNRGPFAAHPQSRLTMKRFDEDAIPDQDAYEIAKYILAAFDK